MYTCGAIDRRATSPLSRRGCLLRGVQAEQRGRRRGQAVAARRGAASSRIRAPTVAVERGEPHTRPQPRHCNANHRPASRTLSESTPAGGTHIYCTGRVVSRYHAVGFGPGDRKGPGGLPLGQARRSVRGLSSHGPWPGWLVLSLSPRLSSLLTKFAASLAHTLVCRLGEMSGGRSARKRDWYMAFLSSPACFRPSWRSIPDALREGIATRTGSVVQADSPVGGFTPGLATCLTLCDGGRVFIKALPADHPVAASYRHEAASAAHVAGVMPVPAMRWHDEIAGWIVLAFDAVDGRHSRLGPSDEDLPAVLDAVTALAVPVSGMPQRTERIGPWLHGWADLDAGSAAGLHPWAVARVQELSATERRWIAYAEGTTLVHGDLRADNILITDRGAVFVDWAFAAAGAAWLNLADLVPQMILAGYTPADAERQLADLPVWRNAPSDAITSYAAANAGYWTRWARQPVPVDAPHVREYQARAGDAAVEWIAWRWRHQP